MQREVWSNYTSSVHLHATTKFHRTFHNTILMLISLACRVSLIDTNTIKSTCLWTRLIGWWHGELWIALVVHVGHSSPIVVSNLRLTATNGGGHLRKYLTPHGWCVWSDRMWVYGQAGGHMDCGTMHSPPYLVWPVRPSSASCNDLLRTHTHTHTHTHVFLR